MSNQLPSLQFIDGYAIAQFDSVGQMITCAFDPSLGNCHSAKVFANSRQIIHNTKLRWANYRTTQWCMSAIDSPVPVIMSAVELAKKDLEDKLPNVTRKSRKRNKNQTHGNEIDADKLAQGLSDCWDQIVVMRIPKKVVRICVNITVHCKQEPEELRWRGATAAALADLLTAGGHSVEIIGVFHVANICPTLDKMAMEIMIKRADQPLDIAAVATSLASIGFFRIAVLNVASRLCKTEPYEHTGYARQIKNTLLADGRDYDIILDYGVDTRDAAMQIVESYNAHSLEQEEQ